MDLATTGGHHVRVHHIKDVQLTTAEVAFPLKDRYDGVNRALADGSVPLAVQEAVEDVAQDKDGAPALDFIPEDSPVLPPEVRADSDDEVQGDKRASALDCLPDEYPEFSDDDTRITAVAPDPSLQLMPRSLRCGPGISRKGLPVDPAAPKRGVGRPRIHPIPPPKAEVEAGNPFTAPRRGSARPPDVDKNHWNWLSAADKKKEVEAYIQRVAAKAESLGTATPAAKSSQQTSQQVLSLLGPLVAMLCGIEVDDAP